MALDVVRRQGFHCRKICVLYIQLHKSTNWAFMSIHNKSVSPVITRLPSRFASHYPKDNWNGASSIAFEWHIGAGCALELDWLEQSSRYDQLYERVVLVVDTRMFMDLENGYPHSEFAVV